MSQRGFLLKMNRSQFSDTLRPLKGPETITKMQQSTVKKRAVQSKSLEGDKLHTKFSSLPLQIDVQNLSILSLQELQSP